MTFGLASFVLLITALVLVIVLYVRATDCRYWRKPENNRRKEAATYEGPDRRRCTKCPYAADHCAALGVCHFEEPK